MSTVEFSREELLICVLARMLTDCHNVATGNSSPIPGSAALLAEAVTGGRCRAMILGSDRHNPFNDGGPELFDRAGQGRIDAFFLGGGEIDGEANINLVGTGDYPASTMRFPGSFGSAYLNFTVPKVILFREEHTPRTLVPKVDFISAPGWSPAGVHRPGGPHALVTNLAMFLFERDHRRFRLQSVHPGHTAQEVREKTGFEFHCPDRVPETPPPEPERLALIRGPVRDAIAETYPEFAAGRLARRF